jgi:hypothetical protein
MIIDAKRIANQLKVGKIEFNVKETAVDDKSPAAVYTLSFKRGKDEFQFQYRDKNRLSKDDLLEGVINTYLSEDITSFEQFCILYGYSDDNICSFDLFETMRDCQAGIKRILDIQQ